MFKHSLVWISIAIAALALPLLGACGPEVGDETPTPEPTTTPEPTPEVTPEVTPEEPETEVDGADPERAARVAGYLATFDDADRARANPLSGNEGEIRKGKEEFDSTCFPCHGREGKGDGPAAAAMGIKPIDHTDPVRAGEITDGERFLILKHGIPDTAMQPFGAALSDDQVWRILAFVETLRTPPAPPE